MKRLFTLCAVSLACLASSAWAQGSIFPSKQQRELARRLDPSTVSAEARAFVKSKMKAHGRDLRELSMAVATLDFAKAKTAAQGIANQPRFDPAAAGAKALPPEYFALQDALRKVAGELATAADQADGDEMVTTYAHVVQTCASCHHAFVKPAAKK